MKHFVSENLGISNGRAWLVRQILNLVVLTVLSLLLVGVAVSQVNTADLVGTVTDASGAVMRNVRISVTNEGTGVTRTANTDENGNYTFTLLQVGTYTVSAESSGFKRFTSKGLVLAAGDRARVDARLTVGQSSETIEVEATTPALQSESSTVGTLLTSKAVQDLPLNGRNFIQLVMLAPGVNEGTQASFSSGLRPDDRRATSSYAANGSTDLVNNNLIDGMDNNERIIGTIGVRPSIDAIQEVKVQTNLYTAEVSRSAGAVVDIITKSGGNQFHGSVFEYFRNDIFDARDYFKTTGTKPELRQNQYGASIGGPIRKNKTFFFGDYEGFRQVKGLTFSSQVPTLAEQNSVANGGALDLTDIGGPIIPAGSLDPIGLALFQLYPKPTTSNVIGPNFTSSLGKTQVGTTFDGRIDHHISNRNNLWGRYSFNDFTTFTPGSLPAVGGVFPGDGYGPGFSFPGAAKERQQSFAIVFDHTFTPSVVLELKLGYLRSAIASQSLNTGKKAATALGFPCTANSCINIPTSDGDGLPLILGRGSIFDNNPGRSDSPANAYAALGDAGYLPLLQYDNTFQYGGSLTWVRGAHSFKFGSTLLRRQAKIGQSAQPRGAFGFGNTASAAFCGGAPGCSGKFLGDLVLGQAEFSYRVNSLFAPLLETWEPSFFTQDDWHVRPWLTLNLGVRYDIYTPYTEPHNHISNFDPATGLIVSPALTGPNKSSSTAGVKTDYGDFAPRIGFAATIAPGTVLRGGFGMTYFPMNYTAGASLKNAPFTFSTTCGIAGNGPGGPLCAGQFGNAQGYALLSGGLPVPVLDTTLATDTANYPKSGVPAATDVNYRASYLEQFSLQLQKDLKGNVFTLGYVGNLGHALLNNINVNRKANPGVPNPYAGLYGGASINQLQTQATSRYHALQAVFERRFTHGLAGNVNYTWAHNITNSVVQDASNTSTGDCVGNGCIVDNPGGAPSIVNGWQIYDLGNSELDIRHHLTITTNYDLPFGRQMHGFEAALIKGWSFNLSGSWHTGTPFTILNGTSVTGIGVNGRPNQIGDAHVSNPSINGWFNTGAFALQAANTLGNERRNQVYGPPQRSFNVSLFKTFPITEAMRLQFRAEAFNISNTPNFANPNATCSANVSGTPCTGGNFGKISNTNPLESPRELQFALKLLF